LNDIARLGCGIDGFLEVGECLLEISGVIGYGTSDGQYARLLRGKQIACRQYPLAESLGLRPSAKMLQKFDPQNWVCVGRGA
jgi:hypothetical protein